MISGGEYGDFPVAKLITFSISGYRGPPKWKEIEDRADPTTTR